MGALVDHLAHVQLLDSTVILFMSDNGFAFGEHGLIDKRTAYEESMRIPLIVSCPELFEGGRVVPALAANLDIAPTVLELAGLKAPAQLRGRSLVPLARGKAVPVARRRCLYEYYWSATYPQTPTLHALRSDTHKYIRAHGLWDLDELFDLSADPLEMTNLALREGPAGSRPGDERPPVGAARRDRRERDPALPGPRTGDRAPRARRREGRSLPAGLRRETGPLSRSSLVEADQH